MRDRSCNESSSTLTRDEAIELIGNHLYESNGMPCTWDWSCGVYHSWQEVFGSTAGPFDGIGGQAMTWFRMEAWVFGDIVCVFCNGKVVKVASRFGFQVKFD